MYAELNGIEIAGAGFHDAGVVGGHELLGGVEQLFMDLLSLSETDDLYRDLFSRRIAGQADQLCSDLHDANGLAHIKYEDLPTLSHDTGFDDQSAGLGYGHKISRDLRMRDGDGAAGIKQGGLIEEGAFGLFFNGSEDGLQRSVVGIDGHVL